MRLDLKSLFLICNLKSGVIFQHYPRLHLVKTFRGNKCRFTVRQHIFYCGVCSAEFSFSPTVAENIMFNFAVEKLFSV